MPTIAEDMLGILDDARGYLADEGFRRYTVTRRLRTWSEGEVGRGVPLDSDLVLSPNPKVRERDDKLKTMEEEWQRQRRNTELFATQTAARRTPGIMTGEPPAPNGPNGKS